MNQAPFTPGGFSPMPGSISSQKPAETPPANMNSIPTVSPFNTSPPSANPTQKPEMAPPGATPTPEIHQPPEPPEIPPANSQTQGGGPGTTKILMAIVPLLVFAVTGFFSYSMINNRQQTLTYQSKASEPTVMPTSFIPKPTLMQTNYDKKVEISNMKTEPKTLNSRDPFYSFVNSLGNNFQAYNVSCSYVNNENYNFTAYSLKGTLKSFEANPSRITLDIEGKNLNFNLSASTSYGETQDYIFCDSIYKIYQINKRFEDILPNKLNKNAVVYFNENSKPDSIDLTNISVYE